MNSSYPIEHCFLLKCSTKSNFYNEVKACLNIDNEQIVFDLCEKIEILSNSLKFDKNIYSFISALDDNTLNYSFEKKFLDRYRSTFTFVQKVSPKEFESLCAYYVSLLGCEDFRVTRWSSDQGLDFYGTLPFKEKNLFGPVSEKVFLIGQAKLYNAKVGTGEIREFFGSIELLKRKLYSDEKYAYSFATELKPYTLINPIFISSSSFSKDAIKLCKSVGIRIIDIVKLISLLTTVDDIFDDNNQLIKDHITGKISKVQKA